MKEKIEKLPKWARKYISDLEYRVEHAEKTLQWAEPGMEWFTIFPPDYNKTPQRLYTCSENGTQSVCSLSPEDYVFVGRGKRK